MNCGIIRRFMMPLPPLEEQDAISEAIASLHERERREHAVVEEQRAVKFALMSVLLTGELRVTPDESAA
jgi:type I restriction enzyme S subunit